MKCGRGRIEVGLKLETFIETSKTRIQSKKIILSLTRVKKRLNNALASTSNVE